MTLQVEFSPMSAGSAAGRVTIHSNSANGSTSIVDLSGTGVAENPQLSVKPWKSKLRQHCSGCLGDEDPDADFNRNFSSDGAGFSGCLGKWIRVGWRKLPDNIESDGVVDATATVFANNCWSAIGTDHN